MKHLKKKKLDLKILAVIIFLGIAVLLLIQKSDPVQNPETSILLNLKTALRSGNPIKEWQDAWKDDSGRWIPLKGNELFLQAFDPNVDSYYKETPYEPFSNLEPKAESFFQENGFVKNKNNYNLTLNSSYKNITSYEKGPIKCLVKYSYFDQAYYGCGIYDVETENLNKQFMKALNPENNLSLYFGVRKMEGDYAFGFITDNPYGISIDHELYFWLAIKESGAWRKIPNNISCSELERYNVPEDINFEGMCR